MSSSAEKMLGVDRDKLWDGMREAARSGREQRHLEDTLVDVAKKALDAAFESHQRGLVEQSEIELRFAQTTALVAIASELRSLRYVR